MRSTFSVLFYTKNQSLKNGKVPVMGRITINKTTACFSCKKVVTLTLWDAKANRAKGKSEEARALNLDLDNIKVQMTKHYQYLCDHDGFVTAKKVYERYNGFGDDFHTLMEIFNIQIEDYKKRIGKGKAKSTYDGLVSDRSCLLHYLKDRQGVDDLPLAELDLDFIKDFYDWMLSVSGLAKSTAFERINTLKWLMSVGYASILLKSLLADLNIKNVLSSRKMNFNELFMSSCLTDASRLSVICSYFHVLQGLPMRI